MKTQMISLSIMFVVLVLLTPFPEIDSLRRTFTTGLADTPVSAVQSVIALEQSTPSVDPQEDTGSADEPMTFTCASGAEPERTGVTPVGSRIIRETGLEEYQMEKHSVSIRETQVSRSSQHSFTPKSRFYASSIHGNTLPARHGFDFNDLLQKRYHVIQRSNIKQSFFTQQVPYSAVGNWTLPGNGQNNPPDEQPFIPQQIDDGTFRENTQMFNRVHQHRSVPSVRPARRAAGSLSSGTSTSQR
ncbi:MAG: hypothetical protein KAT47_01485 [Candidatus Aegiribacteria sp.]|nr:hypothetical protein [Candidatus Aegiribacteria sp.]